MRIRLITIALAVAVTAFALLVAGCGSDDETSSTSAEAGSEEASEESATSTVPAGSGETVKIEMGEFYYKPDQVPLKVGPVTIDATNVGSEPHELVVAKTDDPPANLPTGSDGGVDEAALDVPGEVEEVAGGASRSVTLDLEPGKYVMFCNLPGHYASGMYGSLTVK